MQPLLLRTTVNRAVEKKYTKQISIINTAMLRVSENICSTAVICHSNFNLGREAVKDIVLYYRNLGYNVRCSRDSFTINWEVQWNIS